MASGYQIDGTDLDDLCEPYIASKAVNSNGQDLSTFSVNGTAMTNRYQKANTDSWANVITLPLQRDGVAVKTVAKGYLPTQTKFAEITSAGTYNVSVSDTYFTIGSTHYHASSFRGGVIPRYIGVMLCGGGGGAGGYGCDKGDKNGYNITQGGGGGGGGVMLLVIDSQLLKSVVIGSGGSGGALGSSDSRPSTGSNGGSGGQTILNFSSGATAGCYGGSGGNGGKGNSGSNDSVWGDGGAGGTSWCPDSDGLYSPTHISGGKGGVCGASGGQALGSGAYSFTTGAGIDTTTMFNNSDTGQAVDSGDSFRNSWAGGGCSIGSGATNSSSAGYGGGGASGNNNKNGGNGYCAFYY